MTDFQVFLVILGFTLVLFLDLAAIIARTALRHSSLARLIHLRELDKPHAESTLELLEKMPRPYAGLHIAQSFLRFILIGGIFFLIQQDQRIDSLIEIIAILLCVGLVIALIEWIIERRILRDPERWVLRFTSFVRYTTLVFYPFVNLSLILSRETARPNENVSMVTEDALKTLVDVGQKDGILEVEERKMIHSIFQLGDTLTREIMVPRIDVQALEIGTPLSDAVEFLLSTGFSRTPVFEESIDNILGLIYAKDLLQVWQEGNGTADIRRDLLRDPYYVPEAKKVDELLGEMQKRRVHMAIVVDEYGGVAGVVTLEDIIEEIFGEIQDEYDEDEELPYSKLEDGDYLFRGRIDLDDFNEIMDSNLPNDEADTLSGFIYTKLGHVPKAGESIKNEKLLLTVETVSNRRIRKVRAQRIWKNEEQNDD
ncbi:MAG: HlyC/CorC family transporter [Anaerolineales bacterium]|nr:HlyC/CorC family transporter [Chloroflexota bacterium]MBL6980277.1 HlyC/CorC family transporter [Anaerolineales bacterium]